MRFRSLAGPLALLAACSGPPSAECGPGTRLDDGYCLPTDGDCPEGSVAMDGVCVSERAVVDPGVCGEATSLDEETMRCVSTVRCAEGEIVHEGVCLDPAVVDAASADCLESGAEDDRRLGGVPTPCAVPAVVGESVIVAGELAPTEWDSGAWAQDLDAWTLDVGGGDVLVVTTTQLGAVPVYAELDCDGARTGGTLGVAGRDRHELAAAEGPCILTVSGIDEWVSDPAPYVVVITRRAMPEPQEIRVGERVAWSPGGLDDSIFRVADGGSLFAFVMNPSTGARLRQVEAGVPAYGDRNAVTGSLLVGASASFFLTAHEVLPDRPGFELELVELSATSLGAAAPDATTSRAFAVPAESDGHARIEVAVGEVLEDVSYAGLSPRLYSGRDGAMVEQGWLNVDQTEPLVVVVSNPSAAAVEETLHVTTQTPMHLGELVADGAPTTSTPITLASGVRYYTVRVEDPMGLRVTADSTSGTPFRMRLVGRLHDRDGFERSNGAAPLELTARVREPGWVTVEISPTTGAPLVGVTVTAESL